MFKASAVLGFEFGDHAGLTRNRLMDRIVWQVDKERLLLVGLHEFNRFGGFAIREEFTLRSIDERGNAVRRNVTRGLAAMIATDVHIKAMLIGIISFIPSLEPGSQMPLTDARRGVASSLQLFS